MEIVFAALAALAAASLAFLVLTIQKTRRLERVIAERDAALSAAKTETIRIQQVSEAAVQEVHKLVNLQLDAVKKESERVRDHYEVEARELRAATDEALANALRQVQSLQKYQAVADAEREANRLLAEALEEATSLRSEANALLEVARAAASPGRSEPSQRPRES